MSQSKISIIELFAGVGAQVAALKRLGVDYKVVGISEIDKYAIQSYNAINGPTFNYGDITKIPMLDYADLWTYSFCCQDISQAGKQKGLINEDGTLTRSGLLLHVERLLETAVLIGNQPKYLLLENVKALVSKKFKPDFDRWLQKLESLGYNNYWQVLNAKDYGVPQNRERVFVVSIRKDVDTKGYKFPEKIPLTRKLKDVLEPIVDEKYYLSQDKVDKLVMNMDKEVINTIRCGGGGSLDGKHTWDMVACASRGRNPENPSDRTAGAPTEQRLEVNQTGCSNTITTVEKDNYLLEPLHIKEATQKGFTDAYEGDSVSLDQPNSTARRGRVGNQISNTLTCSCNTGVVQLGNIVNTGNWDNPQAGRVYSTDDINPTLNTMQGGQREPKILDDTYANRAIREYNEFSPTIRAEREGLKVAEGVSVNINSRKAEFNGFKEVSPALRATDYKCPHTYSNGYRIRKLTPLECWRLMDFTDEEFYAAQLSGVSNSQLYKCAGNSIVVAVLQAIFKELLA